MEEKKQIKISIVWFCVVIFSCVALVAGIIIGLVLGKNDTKEPNTNNSTTYTNTNANTGTANNNSSNVHADVNNNTNTNNTTNIANNDLETFKGEINQYKNTVQTDMLPFIEIGTSYYTTEPKYEYYFELLGADKNDLKQQLYDEGMHSNFTRTYTLKTQSEMDVVDQKKVLTKISSDSTKLYISPIFQHTDEDKNVSATPFEVYEVKNINGKIKQVYSLYGRDCISGSTLYILLDSGAIMEVDLLKGVKSGSFEATQLNITTNTIKPLNIYGAVVSDGYEGLWHQSLIIQGNDNNFYLVNSNLLN